MRHNKKFNHLGRTHSHRAAMLANMAISLIMHKRITTTLPKAKALRVYVEPLITKSKEDTTASRRVVFSYLQNNYAITELFGEIAKAVAERPGGYTRIIKLGRRASDDAEWHSSNSLTSTRTWLRLRLRRLAHAAHASQELRLRHQQKLPRLQLLKLQRLRLQKHLLRHLQSNSLPNIISCRLHTCRVQSFFCSNQLILPQKRFYINRNH